LDQVPTAHFDSDQFPPHEGLAAWRHMTGSLYQTWPRGEPEGFRAEADGYKVGELVFNQERFTPARAPAYLPAPRGAAAVRIGDAGPRGGTGRQVTAVSRGGPCSET
jgi:hypothetical protein